MRFWAELKSLSAQSIGEVYCVLVMRPIFRKCGNESQQGLKLGEKLATPLTVMFFTTEILKCSFYYVCNTRRDVVILTLKTANELWNVN